LAGGGGKGRKKNTILEGGRQNQGEFGSIRESRR